MWDLRTINSIIKIFLLWDRNWPIYQIRTPMSLIKQAKPEKYINYQKYVFSNIFSTYPSPRRYFRSDIITVRLFLYPSEDQDHFSSFEFIFPILLFVSEVYMILVSLWSKKIVGKFKKQGFLFQQNAFQLSKRSWRPFLELGSIFAVFCFGNKSLPSASVASRPNQYLSIRFYFGMKRWPFGNNPKHILLPENSNQ